jgi:hypothetical protein
LYYTDDHKAYAALNLTVKHQIILHGKEEYVRDEFMVLEECWNISKNDLLVLTYYPSCRDFRIKIGQYFRTKRFKFNMRKYLTGYGGAFILIWSSSYYS